MRTIPTDTRLRILALYDAGRHTRAETASLFGVSLGFVKKLLQQRKRLGHAAPLHGNAGRKPALTAQHREAILAVIAKNPGATLWMIREEAALPVSQQALHTTLGKMGLTLKKKHSAPRSRTAPMSSPPARRGSAASPNSPPNALSSATNPRRKRT